MTYTELTDSGTEDQWMLLCKKKWQQIIYTSLWKNTMRYKASKAKGSLIQLYPAANLQEILIRTEEHVERHQVCAAWEVQSMGDSVALIAWDFFSTYKL